MKFNISRQIWFCTLAIIGFGLVALYSASYQNSRVSDQVFYDQLYCAFFGVLLLFVVSKFDFRRYFDIAYPLYVVNLCLLIFVLLLGRHAMGAQRWIEIAGINFQPSEISKLALILALARYFSQRRPRLAFNFLSQTQSFIHDLLIPLGATGIVMLFIFKQPDLGTSLLMMGIFIVMIFAADVDKRWIFGFLGVCCAIVPFSWSLLRSYQKDRLLVFLNPNIDPLGAGYTIIQSKIAIGSGGLIGKGWLSGSQNQLNFLPERHTDFIFSVVGEEWGLVGSVCLIFLYFLLIWNGLTIADKIKDKFGKLLAVGVVSILALQVIINIGMVMGLFPIVGLTLPLMSYGRTSFVLFIVMVGILLNLSGKRTIFY